MAAVRKGGWGGPRKGSGRRPVVEGQVRRNRVVVMLTDDQLVKLEKLADQKDLPVGTVAYDFVARALKRRK